MVLTDTYAELAPAPATSPSWVVVVLAGELDFSSSRALSVLDEAVDARPGAHVLVDLSDVTFLDHTALLAFARARSRATARGGMLTLHGASSFAFKLLQIFHLEPGWAGPPGRDDAA